MARRGTPAPTTPTPTTSAPTTASCTRQPRQPGDGGRPSGKTSSSHGTRNASSTPASRPARMTGPAPGAEVVTVAQVPYSPLTASSAKQNAPPSNSQATGWRGRRVARSTAGSASATALGAVTHQPLSHAPAGPFAAASATAASVSSTGAAKTHHAAARTPLD